MFSCKKGTLMPSPMFTRPHQAAVRFQQRHCAHLLRVSGPHPQALHFPTLPDAGDVVHLLENRLSRAAFTQGQAECQNKSILNVNCQLLFYIYMQS